VSEESSGSGKPRRSKRAVQPSAPPEISALEQALRRALDSVPRDQVVKCIVSVLPATVFVDESTRLHGGKVRKVSVSMPEELAEAVRARTGSGGFSRYVTDAVQEQFRLNLLDELSAQLQAEFGQFDEEGVRQAMRLWTDGEEET
jgi:Arc/MetJ-type ribon-helix-helix transcriptional regulator